MNRTDTKALPEGITFESIRAFGRGVMTALLRDAYAFDKRYEESCLAEWQYWDDYFFDHPQIADACGFVTTLDGKPIGFIVWDPRRAPEYEIGNNCVVTERKGAGYGVLQLSEAVGRMQAAGAQRIVVRTDETLTPARRMYARAGFREVAVKPRDGFNGAEIYLEYDDALRRERQP